jgi:hypothetical protein
VAIVSIALTTALMALGFRVYFIEPWLVQVLAF